MAIPDGGSSSIPAGGPEQSITEAVLAKVQPLIEEKGLDREVIARVVEQTEEIIEYRETPHAFHDVSFLSRIIEVDTPQAKRIIDAVLEDMAQNRRESDHRMEMDRTAARQFDVSLDIERGTQAGEDHARRRGLTYGFAIAGCFIGAAVVLGLRGHDALGGICVGGAALGVVPRFIEAYRGHQQAEE